MILYLFVKQCSTDRICWIGRGKRFWPFKRYHWQMHWWLDTIPYQREDSKYNIYFDFWSFPIFTNKKPLTFISNTAQELNSENKVLIPTTSYSTDKLLLQSGPWMKTNNTGWIFFDTFLVPIGSKMVLTFVAFETLPRNTKSSLLKS